MHKIYTDGNGILTGFAVSRIGGRGENQDSYGWKDTSLGYVVTVCDGMGGGPGGKTASEIAVKEIVAGIAEGGKDEDTANVIVKAVRRANMAIIDAGNESKTLKGMGSTATVLLLSKKSAYVAHVGDSRVYQLRGRKKIFRTFDHSMVFELVSQGVITEEQARLSANSNIITRALGVKPDVEVDVQELPYEKGDRFLLCTDGIHGTMPERELIKLVSDRSRKLGTITDDVAMLIDDMGRSSGGGHDNLTLALIETKITSKLKPKMSKQVKLFVLGLIALLVVSVALNISQGKSIASYEEQNDSIQRLNDSITAQAATITELQNTIDTIGSVISKIKNNK